MATAYEKPNRASGATLPTVARRLAALRTQINLWFALEGTAYVLWSGLGLALASFLLDYFFRLEQQQRAFLLVLTCAALVLVFARRVLRPMFTPLSDDGLILEVERRHPELAESLISAVQFTRLGDEVNPHASRAMMEATIRRGSEAAEAVRFTDVINSAGLGRNVLTLLAAVAIIGGLAYGSTIVPHIRIWFERNVLLHSLPYPQDTYLEILRAENGRIRIPRGDDYTLQVRVKPESTVTPERVFVQFQDGRPALAMKRVESAKSDDPPMFEAVIANVIQPFSFWVRGGDERTDPVTVELVEPPAIENLELSLVYPRYAGGKTEVLPAGKGPYFVLPGCSLKLTGKGNKPLSKAYLAREGQRHELTIDSNNVVAGELAASDLATGQYAIELTDAEGLTARRPTTFGLRLRADRKPRVRVKLVGIGGMVTSRAMIPVQGRVIDDYGVTRVAAPYVWRGDDEQRKEGSGELPLPSGKTDGAPLEVAFEDVLDLQPLNIPTGTGLTFYVEAADNDDFPDTPGEAVPNKEKSPDNTVRVVTDEELRADLLRREKEQRQEFERLANQQLELLTFSREMAAQLANAAELTEEQKQKLAQNPKQQKLIATNANSVTQRLASIVIEIKNNRLEDAAEEESSASSAEDDPTAKIKRSLGKRLQTKIVEPLQTLQQEGFPEAVRLVENARRLAGDKEHRREALEQLVMQQEAVHAAMLQILGEMSQAEGFQEIVNALYEVEKLEKDVHERTKRASDERQKGIIEGSKSSKPEDTENK
jgi:hypothetical protein